jgi:hypothetical protein
MKIKSFLFFILTLCILCTTSYADPIYKVNKLSWGQVESGNFNGSYAPINLEPQSLVFNLALDPGYATDAYIIGPEIWTQISGAYDYKTNGEVNHYLQVDKNNPKLLHSVDVIAALAEPGGATTRRTMYAISDDSGATWFNIGEVPANLRSGYPVLHLRYDSIAVICNHNIQTSQGVVNAHFYADIAPQAGGFNQTLGTFPYSIWPQIAVLSNGNVGVLTRPQHITGSDYDTSYFQIWNGTTMGTKFPVYITTPPYNGAVGSNCSQNIASNYAGRITAAFHGVLENDTLNDSKAWYRTSVDNGVTWGDQTLLFTPYIEPNGDTMVIAGGSDLVYKRGTNKWFYSAVLSKGTFEGNIYASATIKLFRSDGTSSTIVLPTQLPVTPSFTKTMSFVFSIDQPALGFSADGNILYCVYAVVTPDTGATGYNSRDVFYQASPDEGATWSAPVRITNTPGIDECYPSISLFNKGNSSATYELNITYMKDSTVGPASFGGSAPASINYQIYRKITQAVPPIGIENNNQTALDYRLNQNYPNPFNPSTTISFNLKKDGFVTLKIYNLLGQEVKTLINKGMKSGQHTQTFIASDLTSGIYFYTINSNGFTDTKKMVLVK